MINQLKTVLFLGLLTGLILVIGKLLGGTAGLTIALVFAILINFIMFFVSHKLVLWMYKAKEAPKSKYPKLHKIVEDLCKEAKLPKPKIYIVPTENPNAFATGPTYKKAVVAVTDGILNLLTEEELKGVLAHELAHIKNRDMLITTIAATLAAVISYIANIFQWFAIFGGGDEDNRGNILGLLALAILTPIIAMIIQLAISRSREYIADETGARFIKTGEPLAIALEKLEAGNKSNPLRMGNQATNSMFIVNPFRGTGQFFTSIFSTHPNTKSRTEKLRSLKL